MKDVYTFVYRRICRSWWNCSVILWD